LSSAGRRQSQVDRGSAHGGYATACAFIDAMTFVSSSWRERRHVGWSGRTDQQRLGAVNACMLANNFVENTFDVLIRRRLNGRDVVVYRSRLDRPSSSN